jgi:hypothetical protein
LSEVAGKPVLSDQTILVESTALQRFSFRFSADGAHLLFVEDRSRTTERQGADGRADYYLSVDGHRSGQRLASPPPGQWALGAIASFSHDGIHVCITEMATDDDDRVTITERRVLDLEGRDVPLDYTALCRLPVSEPSNLGVPHPSRVRFFEGFMADHQVEVERSGPLMQIVIDEAPQPVFDMVWPPWFAPDGSELRYGAVDRDRLVWVRVPLAPPARPK